MSDQSKESQPNDKPSDERRTTTRDSLEVVSQKKSGKSASPRPMPQGFGPNRETPSKEAPAIKKESAKEEQVEKASSTKSETEKETKEGESKKQIPPAPPRLGGPRPTFGSGAPLSSAPVDSGKKSPTPVPALPSLESGVTPFSPVKVKALSKQADSNNSEESVEQKETKETSDTNASRTRNDTPVSDQKFSEIPGSVVNKAIDQEDLQLASALAESSDLIDDEMRQTDEDLFNSVAAELSDVDELAQPTDTDASAPGEGFALSMQPGLQVDGPTDSEEINPAERYNRYQAAETFASIASDDEPQPALTDRERRSDTPIDERQAVMHQSRRSNQAVQSVAPSAYPNDEFLDEKTEVSEYAFLADEGEGSEKPVLAVLRGVSSVCMGTTFNITETKTSIGRSYESDIVINDASLSRAHAEIFFYPDGTVVLKDLGSANGTFVNGVQVSVADLRNRDVVKLGDALLNFETTEVVPKNRVRRALSPAGLPVTIDQAEKKFFDPTKIIITVTIVTSIVIGAIIVMLVVNINQESEQRQRREEAAQAYVEGVNAMQTRNWDLAEQHFKQVEKLDKENEEIAGQFARIEKERNFGALLDKALTAKEAGRAKEAKSFAEQIPRTSIYFSDASALMMSLE